MATPALVMHAKGLVKRYGQVTALDGAVVADHGQDLAGKSSLIKALSGATIPDEGEIRLDGKPVHFKSPIEARHAGIECCYQDLAVAPAMTIAENLFLGREMRREGLAGNVLRNGLTLMGVSSVYQVLVTGILVILAVTVDQLSRRAAR